MLRTVVDMANAAIWGMVRILLVEKSTTSLNWIGAHCGDDDGTKLNLGQFATMETVSVSDVSKVVIWCLNEQGDLTKALEA